MPTVCTVRGTIGKIGLVLDAHAGSNMSTNLIRIAPKKHVLESKYLWWYLRSPMGQHGMIGGSIAATISTIKASFLRNIKVPLPSLDRQRRIVAQLDAVEKHVDNLKQIQAANQSELESLTQSILAKAFRGELVPTEAELAQREGRFYEPASTLQEFNLETTSRNSLLKCQRCLYGPPLSAHQKSRNELVVLLAWEKKFDKCPTM